MQTVQASERASERTMLPHTAVAAQCFQDSTQGRPDRSWWRGNGSAPTTNYAPNSAEWKRTDGGGGDQPASGANYPATGERTCHWQTSAFCGRSRVVFLHNSPSERAASRLQAPVEVAAAAPRDSQPSSCWPGAAPLLSASCRLRDSFARFIPKAVPLPPSASYL